MHAQLDLHSRRSLILAGGLLALLGADALNGQVGLGLAPMRLELRVAPPVPHSGTLTLSNEAPSKVRVRAELFDFHLDREALPQFHRELPEERQYSCRPFLSLNPMELELDGGSTARVRYTLRMPADAGSRSYHCAVGFTTLPTAGNPKGIGLNTAVRIIAAFYAITGSPAVEGEIRALRLEAAPDAKPPLWRAVAEFENFSEIYFRPSGTLAVMGPDGKLLEELQLPAVPVLPRRVQSVPVLLTKAPQPGRYVLRARVDIGTRQIQEAVAETEVLASPPARASTEVATLK